VQYKAGKVKGFGVTSLTRSPVAPDIPAMAEFLPGFEVTSWTTVTGPANLPPAVIERISMFTKQALESPGIKQDFFDRGATPVWRTMADTVAFRASEEKRLGDIIRRAKITID
jgi:tripartite-type tricarboxylate transporter receptor subunit TctC